LNKTILFFN